MSVQRFGQTFRADRWHERLSALDPDRVSLFLLVVATYLACFSLSFQTGLYEDDYLHVRYLGWDWESISRLIARALENWPQGRPLARTLALSLVYLSNGFGELAALKAWGFLLLSLNACLTFLILRRVMPVSAAFVGGLMMVVFPGDAAKMEIIRALQLQPVMLLFLSATWLYLRGHRILPYLLIGLSLFIYENVALLFFLVPLLHVPFKQNIVRETLVNGACLAALIVIVILMRNQFGPGDLAGLSSEIRGFNPIERSIISTVLGFLVNLKLLALRPVTSLIEMTVWSAAVILLVGAMAYLFLQSSYRERLDETASRSSRTFNPLKWAAPAQLMLVGVLLILAAYPLMITFERFAPILEIGRRTSCHTAASFGTAIFAAAFFWQSMNRFTGRTAYRRMAIVSAVYLALLAGFQVAVQNGLSLGWSYQRQLWQSVLAATPDLEAGDIIVVEVKDPLPETPYIRSYGFYSNFVLPMIFRFPRNMESKLVWADQISNTTRYFPVRFFAEDDVSLKLPFERRLRTKMDGRIIWLVAEDSEMRRVFGVKAVNGVDFKLKPLTSSASQSRLPRGPLYRYLME